MRSLIRLGMLAIMLLPMLSRSEMTFADLLTGKTHPLSLTLQAMGPEWRRFNLTSGQNQLSDMLVMMRMRAGQPGSEGYFTRGDVVTMGSETFLVAYRVETGPIDFRQLMEDGEELPPIRLTPDTRVTLSLLNLRLVSGLESIQPFDLNGEMAKADAAMRKEQRNKVLSTLRQLALAFQMYAQDNDGQYPPFTTPDEMKAALLPYLGGAEWMFIDPVAETPFQPNLWLSRKHEKVVVNPTKMVVIFQEAAGADGLRGVAFADGHAEFVDAQEWEQCQQASGIR